jgi:tRNA G18 (ribose-2'-O)-methylase SpoU
VRDVVLVVHNIRSAHNVGSLLRTADGLGIRQVILAGFTPYPASKNDSRLPHLAQKIDRRIHKTALGAEQSVSWRYAKNVNVVIEQLKKDSYVIAVLEQNDDSIPLKAFRPAPKTALLVSNEVAGSEPEVLASADVILEIPMLGQKESFNVASAAAMALYHLTTLDK